MGERQKSSTIVNQYHHKETLIAAKNEILSLYQNEKEEQKKNGKREYQMGGSKVQ